jgi:putative ABC transport system permease protein
MTTTGAARRGASGPAPGRLTLIDLARMAGSGIATRKVRAGLSALGIAIGVAAIVGVLGLSSSSAAGLNAEIAALGTNLLTVQSNAQALTAGSSELSLEAPAMISRLPGVYQVQSTGFTDVNVYRSPLIPSVNTKGLSVAAATLGVPAAIATSVAHGKFLNAATAREPVCVLGAAAAQLLGINKVFDGERIWITGVSGSGGMWLYVAGILHPALLAPDIDASVLVGFPFAQQYLGFDGHPSTVYVRATDSRVNSVYNLLPTQANPENPSSVGVSLPSSALVAQKDARSAFNTLFLGLGAIALLVGAIGVANIMIIAVLERRSEIGLRRALGATRGHIRTQFLTEAIALSLLGGAAGVIAGGAATLLYAHARGWPAVIPSEAWAGGMAAALLIGAFAGLLPAIRAARLSPTQALWSI